MRPDSFTPRRLPKAMTITKTTEIGRIHGWNAGNAEAKAADPAATDTDRTSVVLRLDNVPGALVSAMTELSIRDIDLTRIESRPTRTELGTYMFFLDCVGHIDDDSVAEALKALFRRCADVRYLGSWPTGSATGALPPQLDEASQWLTRLREGTA